MQQVTTPWDLEKPAFDFNQIEPNNNFYLK